MQLVGTAFQRVIFMAFISTLATLERASGSAKHSVCARVRLCPREPGDGVTVKFGSEVKVEKSMMQILTSAVENSLARGRSLSHTSISSLLPARSPAGVSCGRCVCVCGGTEWGSSGSCTSPLCLSGSGTPEGETIPNTLIINCVLSRHWMEQRLACWSH